MFEVIKYSKESSSTHRKIVADNYLNLFDLRIENFLFSSVFIGLKFSVSVRKRIEI